MSLLLAFLYAFWPDNLAHWFLKMKQNSLHLMFSKFEYDGKLNETFVDGPLELPVSSIWAYMKEPITPSFVHVGSTGVTRPERPLLDLSKQPPAIRLNKELGYILTFKLKDVETDVKARTKGERGATKTLCSPFD